MCKLKAREQRVWDLMQELDFNMEAVASKLNLAVSSVRTYFGAARRKMQSNAAVHRAAEASTRPAATLVDSLSKWKAPKPIDWKSPEPIILKRCRTFTEFEQMMAKVPVKGTSLQDRVNELRDVYCKVCTYPDRCNQCPTKVLFDKYLGPV